MKKFQLVFIVLIASILTIACSKEVEEKASTKKEVATTEQKNTTEETSQTVEPVEEETQQKDPTGMLIYKPQVGTVKEFVVEGSAQTYKEEYVFENGEYIQKVTTMGQAVTVQIYKWNAEEISLVLEDKEPIDAYSNYLTDLPDIQAIDTYTMKGDSDWMLVSEDNKVSVPSGDYSMVLIFEKESNEVEGEDTIRRTYFAPEVGLIEEDFELTGEQGYSAKSVLASVEIK